MRTDTKNAEIMAELSLSWPGRLVLGIAVALLMNCFGFGMTLELFGPQESVEAQFRVYEISALLNICCVFGFVVCILLQKHIRDRFFNRKRVYIGLCAVGAVGNVTYAMYATNLSVALLVFSMVLLVLFCVGMLNVFCVRLSMLATKEIGLIVALGGCFYAILRLLAASSIPLSSYAVAECAIYLLILSFFHVLPFYQSCLLKKRNEIETIKRNRHIIFFVIGIVLCVFASVFSNLLTTPELGGITARERLFMWYISLIVYIAMALITTLRSVSQNMISYLFMFCSAVLLMSLFLALVMFNRETSYFATGAIRADQLIFTFYLLVVTLLLIKFQYLRPLVASGLFGIFSLCLPEFLIDEFVKRITYEWSLYANSEFVLITAFVAGGVLLVVFGAIGYDVVTRRAIFDKDIPVDILIRRCEKLIDGFSLSSREAEIIQLVYKGYGVKKIAELLCVSTNTVQSHMRNAYRKLNVHTKQELCDCIDEVEV